MANIRDLKKDIDYLVFEVISDCLLFSDINPGREEVELNSIIEDAVEFRNDLIARVNNPDGKANPKIVKAYYKKLTHDLLAGVDKLFERLSAISVQKE